MYLAGRSGDLVRKVSEGSLCVWSCCSHTLVPLFSDHEGDVSPLSASVFLGSTPPSPPTWAGQDVIPLRSSPLHLPRSRCECWGGGGRRHRMFEVKPMNLDKDSSAGKGGERGANPTQFESLGTGCPPLYLYDSHEWVLSAGCSPEEPEGLSPLLAEETLRYMTFLTLEPSSFSHPGSRSVSQVLSGERVEQMTKTYNDIDMVTHLLAERDRDLELAARIGQSLLQRNHVLQERNEAVEEQLAQALDRIQQLQHELGKKDELLRMVASASEESESDSSCSTPLRRSHIPAVSPSVSQLEALQRKLQELEEENTELRSEACLLKSETITYEEKEQKLVNDCVKELRESNSQMMTLTDELSQKNEQVLRHQEEISQLLTQIVELQHRVKELALEKEELRIHLQASKDAQRQLTAELKEVQDRNAECVGMLHESQEEVRELRSRSAQSAGVRRHLPYTLFPADSLAAEIEGTMNRELSMEDESVLQDQRSSQKRVFQTVRSVNESSRVQRLSQPIPGSSRSSVVMTAQPFRSTLPPAEGDSNRPRRTPPGSPAAEDDLSSVLHRLSLRRQNFLCERRFFQAEQNVNPSAPNVGARGGKGNGCGSPSRSTLSAPNLLEMSATPSCYKTFLPEKLQIVKPMEGSLTLHHWQQLAQPHLATILDPHPGVVTKGFRPLPQDAVYHLTDPEEDDDESREASASDGHCSDQEKRKVEEDEEEEGGITFRVQLASTPEEKTRKRQERPVVLPVQSVLSPLDSPPRPAPPGHPGPCSPSAPLDPTNKLPSTSAPSSDHNPGKCLSSTCSTYTFTTCRILHPSDITQVTASSLGGLQASTLENMPSSLRTGPSTPVTPCRLSLGDSFPPRRPSGPRGLAKLLLEKGISAQVSSRSHPLEPKPSRRPATPPTSPRPALSPTLPSFDPPAASGSENFLASRPAELFLQDVYGLKPGRARVGLLQRLRRLGLATVLPADAVASDGHRNQDAATILATSRGSLLDGLRRNQSLPVMMSGRAPCVTSPVQLPRAIPSDPTTLTLPITPWGSLKDPDLMHSSEALLPPSAPKS
ncbi:trafficking kinesin-binding protein 2-like [Brienomyrus brachyistius]|uniref:trafficking kinesin-binding protein 2-like n=1 Tax=Brienomyrus brachyistius TaxID=42636 RepID=UPI0020B34C57|nr:trafficking kinesin-binding protein 2-like [Brienomyrus brachyistius]